MRTRNIAFFGKMGIIYNPKAKETEIMTETNASNMARKTSPNSRLQNSWLFTSVSEGLNLWLTWPNPASGQDGTWTQKLQILNPSLLPQGQSAAYIS